MYTEIEQQTLDIDWFFTNGEEIAFAASGGGRLHNSIANFPGNYELLSDYFSGLPEIAEIIVNKDLKQIIGSSVDDRYLESFDYMAKRGLYAFDRTVLNNFEATQYHLVAKPSVSLKVAQIPSEISDILKRTIYVGAIDTFSDSASIA